MEVNTHSGWMVDPAAVWFVGANLHQSECKLAHRDGTLWIADQRSTELLSAPAGAEEIIPPVPEGAKPAVEQITSRSTPSRLAFAANCDILVTDTGAGTGDRLARDGTLVTVIDSIDGVPLGRAAYLLRDSKRRLWLTVSTWADSWIRAFKARQRRHLYRRREVWFRQQGQARRERGVALRLGGLRQGGDLDAPTRRRHPR